MTIFRGVLGSRTSLSKILLNFFTFIPGREDLKILQRGWELMILVCDQNSVYYYYIKNYIKTFLIVLN